MDSFFDVPPDDVEPSPIERLQRAAVASLGLTDLESHVLARCYSDGETVAVVAGNLGRTVEEVREALGRACRKVVAAGLPMPRPHGRGNRAEVQATMPALMGLTNPAA